MYGGVHRASFKLVQVVTEQPEALICRVIPIEPEACIARVVVPPVEVLQRKQAFFPHATTHHIRYYLRLHLLLRQEPLYMHLLTNRANGLFIAQAYVLAHAAIQPNSMYATGPTRSWLLNQAAHL